MQVDVSPSFSTPPRLEVFLDAWTPYATSPSTLRMAMKKHLTIEDVTYLLEALEKLLNGALIGSLEELTKETKENGSPSFSQVLISIYSTTMI